MGKNNEKPLIWEKKIEQLLLWEKNNAYRIAEFCCGGKMLKTDIM